MQLGVRANAEASLARDIETLRALIDRLLDQRVDDRDPMLLATAQVLNLKLEELSRQEVTKRAGNRRRAG